ncbi:MAG: 50S ribosomal protein L24 [Candidatus Wukongarchaeota archaeon]|nr:50S ribosomal protein L24 [Candidatus Wukongarchaeota archaeon]MDO8127873.1 50S ribosomal protein L24 [Candidatus Wukongarchaeota archaeon]
MASSKSKQPRKQRKMIFTTPLHKKRKLFNARLSTELQITHGVKRLPIVNGDTVLILRGQYKGIEGEVSLVDTKSIRIHIQGAEREKADGSTVMYPIHPSNVEITVLNLKDSLRKELIERLSKEEVRLKAEMLEKMEEEEF